MLKNSIISLEKNQDKKQVIQYIQKNLTSDNIALYRTIFKGRDDIVSEYWRSKRNDGKGGYSPLCKNKWNIELCNLKKKVRSGCKTCKNKEYTSLSDDLIKKHITGQRILGVYPLLKNNTCNFIAADFDKHKESNLDPLKDVKKYFEVCEMQEIPCYVLRSKSGQGYHVYVFFSDAVPAWKARVVNFALLQEAYIIDEDEKSSTFDRFFPNQDQLSDKTFGNLISLPFQGKAGKKGYTVILNPETNFQEPFIDQWKVLKGIEKINEKNLNPLIKEWDLKQESSTRINIDSKLLINEEKHLAVFSRVKAGCKFVKHCCDDAEILPEPDWYAFLTIVGRCKDGRRQVHKFSENHPAYNYDETEAKLEHALKDSGPYLCETIHTKLKSKYCNKCLFREVLTSPILLGYDKTNDEFYNKIVNKFNNKHAVIMVGGKCHVLNEIIEPVFNRPDITLSSRSDFYNRYANRLISDPQKTNKEISMAEFWFKHKNRREYNEIVFDPNENTPEDTYNLWKGFTIEPKEGNWDLFKNHIYQVIANEKKSILQWILAWIARIIQDPGGKRPGTAIVLRGKQGTGKGIFVNIFGQILGKHFIQIAQSSQVTGRFNSHFKDVLLAFIDEGFWTGDKQAEGVIKNIITEPFITIEQKGKDIIRVKNNVNLIFASNNDWVIPAGLEERRFFVLDVSDKYQQKHSYFKAIINQMNNGGLEAMFDDLAKMDISSVNLRNVPQTEGLFEQKLHSMTTVQKYWLERLKEGCLIQGLIRGENGIENGIDVNQLTGETYWPSEIKTEVQYSDYIKYAERLKERRPLCEAQFGIALNKLCSGVKKSRPTFTNRKRKNIRIFPTLKECRKEFSNLLKMDIDWGEDEENS